MKSEREARREGGAGTKVRAGHVRIERRVSYAGISAAARSLGCSREHLSKVLHGHLKASAALARGLRLMGVAVV
jgi:hypothetical protein